MFRPSSLQVLSRNYASSGLFCKVYNVSPSKGRCIHVESRPDLPGDRELGRMTDLNSVHLDMFFDRVIPLPPPSSRSSSSSARGTYTASAKPLPTEPETETRPPPPRTRLGEHENKPALSTAEVHLFDTYEQVSHLQVWGGFTRQQAKALIETLQHRLRTSVAERRNQLLTSSQLENESYLISAAVAELRREVQLLRRNDSALLQSELTALAREVDQLSQQLSEDLGIMRDDIELTMNDYRSDAREELKTTEHQIQGINNRLTVMLGDAATELESLKWNVIWRGLLGGLVAALGISLAGYVISAIRTRTSTAKRNTLELTDKTITVADMEL